MKKVLLVLVACLPVLKTLAQDKRTLQSEIMLKSTSEAACKCVDSIYVGTKSHAEVTKDVKDCIDKQVMVYQMSAKLFGDIDLDKVINDSKGQKDKTTTIPTNREVKINTNKDSKEYMKYYYEIERFMADSCAAMEKKMMIADKPGDKSLTSNPRAMDLYNKGIDASKKENYQQALPYFEEAVKADPNFAFAWDNIGICYRKLENYDKAIYAYNKSLEIDPTGTMPLQNIAVAYQYKKNYKKSVDAYERLAKIDNNNPEIYYGIGQVYALYLNENEKGLDNMCKAYRLYIEQQSPYRSDAEKIISMIYADMKKQNKEDKFWAILKKNDISFDKE